MSAIGAKSPLRTDPYQARRLGLNDFGGKGRSRQGAAFSDDWDVQSATLSRESPNPRMSFRLWFTRLTDKWKILN